MKYLDEMTKEELVSCAKKEKIFLGLTFNREKIMQKLEKKGYKRNLSLNENVKLNENIKKNESIEKTPENSEKKVSLVEKVAEISEKATKEIEKIKEEIINKDFQDDKTAIKNEVEQVEEIDFSSEVTYIYRSRSYYRNYPNKKLIRSLRKKYRKYKDDFRGEINFDYKGIDADQIKKREKETEINRAKFAKGAEYEGEAKSEDIYFDKAPLPSAYFVDEVVLMPKNPTTLYVYWEIRDDTFEKLVKNKNVVDNIVIKLFKDGNEYRKIIRHERIGSHYIGEIDTNRNYEAFIGYEDEYGNFSEVAHSEKAISPSDKLSDNFDLLWGTVKEDKNTNQLIKYINSPIPTKENEEFIELMRNPVVNDEEFTVEVLERLLKIGASENLAEREIRRTRPDKLIMIGTKSS